MLRNIIRNIVPSNKNILFKRYNIPQAILHVRYKQNITEIGDDIEESRPIKYSTSKAANMRINEYRIPYEPPHYQGVIVTLSLTVFLIYFCILREENDIDEIIDIDLNTSLKRCEEKHNEKTVKLISE